MFIGVLLSSSASLATAQSRDSTARPPAPGTRSRTDTVPSDRLLMSATLAPLMARGAPFVVARLSTENMPVPSTTSPLGSLAGKIAGVTVSRASGAPGADIDIVLRTAFGPLSTSPPQVVVDGIWLNTAFPLTSQDLESADLATIEVLKGPIASALYGARGAAGVVVITTNRGRNLSLGTTQFAVRNEVGADYAGDWIASPLAHPFRVNAMGQYVNAAGLVVPRADRVPQANGIMENRYIDPTYNHADQFFRSGLFNTQTVSLQQNGAATNFRLSYVRNQQPGVVRASDGYQRQTLRLNADYRMASWARASVSTSHARSTEDPSQASLVALNTIDADVSLRAVDPSGKLRYILIPDLSAGQVNPLNQQLFPHRHIERDRTLLNVNVALQPLSFLSLDGAASYDRGNRHQFTLVPRGTPNLNGQNLGTGFLQITNDTSESSLVYGGAAVQKRFGALQSRLSLRAETQHQSHGLIDSTGSQFDLNNIPLVFGKSYQSFKVRTTAAIANAGLEFADRYVADLLVRRERNSMRSTDRRADVFTRVSAAWLVNGEQWLPFSRFSVLKLHAAVGTATANNSKVIGVIGIGEPYSYTEPIPAKTTESEIGLDIAPRDRLRASVVFVSSKLKRVPYGSGVVSCTVCLADNFVEGADFSGHTFEATLQTVVLAHANGLKWDMAIVADRRRNILTKWYRTCFTSDIRRVCDNTDVNVMTGHHLVRDKSELVGVSVTSQGAFDTNDEGYVVPVGAGNSWRDGKSRNLWSTNLTIDGRSYRWGVPLEAFDGETGLLIESKIGDANPALEFGFQNNIQYGGFQLYAQFTGQLGGDVYNNVEQTLYASGDHTDLDQSGKPDELRKPVAYYRALANGNADYLANFVESGTHVQLAEASVGYGFNAGKTGVLHRLGASRIQVELVARNLITLTGYSGLDPRGTSSNLAVDGFAYPRTRTLTLATSIVF